MRLKDAGLTAEKLKKIVNKYMVETYERYPFIAERAEGMYLYDEKGNSVYVYFFCPVYLSYVGIIQIRFSGRNGITSPLSRLSPAPRQQYKGCLVHRKRCT